jgi:hypothetical protein
MKKSAFAAILLALAPSVYASTSVGTVSSYLVSRYGKLFFRAGVTQSPPLCSVAGEFAVDLVGPDGAAGKAILEVIMTAQAAGKTVHMYGKGTCDVWGDRETVEYVVIE